MSATVLAEGHIAIDQSCLDRRKCRRAHVFLAQQPVHRPSPSSRKEHSFRIHPSISVLRRAGADENWTRSAQRH